MNGFWNRSHQNHLRRRQKKGSRPMPSSAPLMTASEIAFSVSVAMNWTFGLISALMPSVSSTDMIWAPTKEPLAGSPIAMERASSKAERKASSVRRSGCGDPGLTATPMFACAMMSRGEALIFRSFCRASHCGGETITRSAASPRRTLSVMVAALAYSTLTRRPVSLWNSVSNSCITRRKALAHKKTR